MIHPATLPALLATAVLAQTSLYSIEPEQQWARHVIDDTSRGADGVKRGDLNRDGRFDLVAGWEEGGVTRVYLHPGKAAVREKWPMATIGITPSAEDATFVDLYDDGWLDVVSSCEGSEQTLYLHYAPRGGRLLDSNRWKQKPLPGSEGMTRWMFATPGLIEQGGKAIRVLFAGSKDPQGTIGYWKIPDPPSTSWQWHPLSEAGWIMSIIPSDMDGDGDTDLFYTDRKGALRGAHWLENPGEAKATWKKHSIGGESEELLFSSLADLDQDGLVDVVATAKDRRLLWWRRLDASGRSWTLQETEYPAGTARAKAVAVGDIDRDGLPDLVANCESATPPLQGVFWLRQSPGRPLEEWEPFGVSGPEGVKFDRIELVDVDGDGDLDILTCEEHHRVGDQRVGLGVVWYENRLAE